MNKKRETFMECLNEMWHAFAAVVDVEKDSLYIERFVEAKYKAHGLLADLANQEMELCTELEAECGTCGKCPVCGEVLN